MQRSMGKGTSQVATKTYTGLTKKVFPAGDHKRFKINQIIAQYSNMNCLSSQVKLIINLDYPLHTQCFD